jgi:hypothetical protein
VFEELLHAQPIAITSAATQVDSTAAQLTAAEEAHAAAVAVHDEVPRRPETRGRPHMAPRSPRPAPGQPREAPEHTARSGASRVRGGSCALSGPAVLTGLRQGSGSRRGPVEIVLARRVPAVTHRAAP